MRSALIALCLLILPHHLFGETPNPSAIEQASNSVVVSKDVTLPARNSYENIVVMSGTVDFFGKADRLIVLGGVVRIHDGAQVKGQLLVFGGKVEQSKGAFVPETKALEKSPIDRLKIWAENWANKWKHRFESPEEADDEEQREEQGTGQGGDKWTKVFFLPFILVIPLSILIILFGLAMLFFTVAPGLSTAADAVLKRDPFVSFAWGALGYLLLTPFVAILTISIIGIPLVPLVAFLAILFILAGFFAASRTIGSLILSRIGIQVSAFDTLLGIILQYGLIFMPFFGKLLVFFILIAGTGAVIRSIFGKDGRSHFRFGSNGTVYDI